MQELELPDVDLRPALLVRARPAPAPAASSSSQVGWLPNPYGALSEVPSRSATANYPDDADLLIRGTVASAICGNFTIVWAAVVVFISVIGAVGVGATWLIADLTHASGLRRSMAVAAKYGAAVLIGLLAVVLVAVAVWWFVRIVSASYTARIARRPVDQTVAVPTQKLMAGDSITTFSSRSPTLSFASDSQVEAVRTIELRVGAVALPIGPDDSPDDAELGKWLKMRRPEHAYHLIRIVCSLDGADDVEVDGLIVQVRLESAAGAGPQPQVVSMLPKTSRTDLQVKRTVKVGANLKLIEASREDEVNLHRGRTDLVARGELQQTATWALRPGTRFEEEKQFLLVVERVAAAPASATIELTAAVRRAGESLTLSASYPGNPLDLD